MQAERQLSDALKTDKAGLESRVRSQADQIGAPASADLSLV
jgi:hypothetical protein